MALLLVCLAPGPAGAADSPIRPDGWHPRPFRERAFFFSGADVARDSFFAWGGVVGSPNGLMHEDGLRFRLMGGAGRYRYRTDAAAGGTNTGDITSGELMIGYRFSAAGTFATVFAGAHIENQSLAAPDPGHPAQGTEAGVKAAVELYRRLTPDLFATASASISTVHRGYHVRAAVAREFAETGAAGMEAAIHGDARYNEPRVGMFVQSRYERTSVTLAGGYLSNSDKGSGYYGTLSLHAEY